MNYNSDKDAHKISNYHQIKERINKITEVIVDLRGLVEPETIQKLLTCLQYQHDFVLFGEEGFVAVSPKNLCSWQNSVVTRYEDANQMVNVIKLLLYNHPEIYITDFEIEDGQKQIE